MDQRREEEKANYDQLKESILREGASLFGVADFGALSPNSTARFLRKL